MFVVNVVYPCSSPVKIWWRKWKLFYSCLADSWKLLGVPPNPLMRVLKEPKIPILAFFPICLRCSCIVENGSLCLNLCCFWHWSSSIDAFKSLLSKMFGLPERNLSKRLQSSFVNLLNQCCHLGTVIASGYTVQIFNIVGVSVLPLWNV